MNIDSDGVARWEGVNQRTNTGNFSYILEAIGADGETVLSQDVGNTVFEDLNRLMNLRAGQSYNICVTARNENGNSTPSCDSYMPEGQGYLLVFLGQLSFLLYLHPMMNATNNSIFIHVGL